MKKPLQNLVMLVCFLILLIAVVVSCTKEAATVPDNVAIASPLKTPALSAVPSLLNLQPNRGRPGDTITLIGGNFSAKASEDVVKFNGVTAVVISATTTAIKVIAPKSSTGNVTLKVKAQESKLPAKFTYLLPFTAKSVAPSSGKEGDVVTITGTNFSTTKPDNIVRFNGVIAPVNSATTTQLKVAVPKGAKTGKVTIVVVSGAPVTAGTFTVDNSDNGDWTDTEFTAAMQEHVITATAGTSIMCAGALKSNFLYYSADGSKVDNVYAKLPFKDKGSLEIRLLAADETTPGGPTFYVTSNQGIAKTQNGTNWTLLSPGGVSGVAGGFTGIIAGNSAIFLLANARLYESYDAGKTWLSTAAPTAAGLDYMVSDQYGKYWYAVDVKNNATDKVKKLYRSTDHGKTWAATKGSTGRYFYDNGTRDFLHISGYTLFCMYNSSNSSASGQKVYKSTDQGDTWTLVSANAQNFVKTAGPIVFYGGKTLTTSTDGGVNFEPVKIPAGYTLSGADIAGDYGYIFCYNGAGVGKTKVFRQQIGH
ncbi:hypothetical protein FFF34_019590 [Inquilinus sp. KBS0705]|nr:hypothetical protein FFF34_019590 [Inquilinus sp. KBS0705]